MPWIGDTMNYSLGGQWTVTLNDNTTHTVTLPGTLDKNGIGSPDRTSYVAYMYDKPVGFFSVYHNEESEEFYGVSIRKPLREKGLGKMMLSAAVKKVLENEKPIIAHVDSENPAAYHIYTTLGFMRTERNDYYIYK